MKNSSLHILLVDDKLEDFLRINGLLSQSPRSSFRMDWVKDQAAALEEIDQKHYDACLVDSSMISNADMENLQRVFHHGSMVPVIFLTGQGDQEVDLRAIQAGAADFLIKDQITPEHLDRSIRYAIERKRAEDALRRSEAQLKSLSSQLLTVHETERRRLAMELHDSLGQILSAIKFGVEASLVHMERGTIKPGALEPIVPMIQQAIQEVRRIYTTLRPTILDDLGIIATLNWYCREFSALHQQLNVVKHFEIDETIIPESIKIIIYRLVQDALENVAVHSQATEAEVSLIATATSIQLSISDNGIGFHIERDPSERTGLGLPSMKERTELSGGMFLVKSVPGNGTTLVASWPRT